MNTIKQATILFAALASLATAQALADTAAPIQERQAVKLSDAQLDDITAGSALVFLFIPNAKAQVGSVDDLAERRVCINCGANPFNGMGGIIAVSNSRKATPTFHCIGSAAAFLGTLCN